MSVSRLFEIVYLLLEKKQITARALAERFEVSVRTIYRDVDALSAAGIPIYASQGRGGGISLTDRFVLDRAALSPEEQARVLTALKSLPGGDSPESRATLTKLSGLFGRREPDWLQVDLTPWGASGGGARRFDELKRAILERRVTTFSYAASYGGASVRRILPARLVFKGRAWYLQGFCLANRDYRTFRLSRILELTVTEERFDLSLSPPAIEAAPLSSSRCTPLRLRFSPLVAYRVYDEFDLSCVKREKDGSLLVAIDFPEDGWLYGYLLSFGTCLEILSPDQVRLQVGLLGRQIWKNCEKPDIRCRVFRATMESPKQKEDSTMERKFCQSCGMPLDDPAFFGTEADGSESRHYCKYCYQGGAFTADMTMDQMIDVCAPILSREHPGMSEEQAKAQMRGFFPKLLRWKGQP